MKSAQRFQHVSITGLGHVDAPHVVTSSSIEGQLSSTFARLGILAGFMESLSGIAARRVWEPGTRPSEVAARAGQIAL